jgi:hypothetical protein
MDDPQAQAADAKTAADLIAAGATPQLETEKVTLGQLDELFTKGTADLPHTVSGGEPPTEKKVEDPPTKTEPEPGAKSAEGEGAEEVVDEEVVETRSAEEIEEAVAAARQKVIDDGGDEAAQEAAAEEARKPVAAAKVEDEPVVEEEEIEDEDEPAGKSKRFRVKDPMAQAALELYRAMESAGTPITLAEAESRVAGPKKEPVKVEPPVDFAKVVTDLETEVTELERQLEERGEAETNFDKDAVKLVNTLSQKRADLAVAKFKQERAEEDARAAAEVERATSEENRTKAHKQAIEDYPDVVDKKSKLGKAVSERIAKMKADPKHPDRPILFADSAPYTIVSMVARELGIPPVEKKVSPPVSKKVVAPPRKVVTPAPGGKTAVQSQTKSPEDAKKQTVEYLKNEAPLEELDELFGMGDQSQLLAGALR